MQRLHAAGVIATENPESLAWGIVAAMNGVFKRVVNDGAATLEPPLFAGTIELISRALFRPT